MSLSQDDIRTAVRVELGNLREEMLKQLSRSIASQMGPLNDAINKLAQRVDASAASDDGQPHPLEDDLERLRATVDSLAGRDVSGDIEQLRRDVQKVVDVNKRSSKDFMKQQKMLHETVEQSSSFSTWTWLVLFQIGFAVAFGIYKVQQNSQAKKMF